MKILSVHIENFGNISDKDFRFGDGLNSFERENGYGKTTLLSFVKAMLYGLSSYKSNTKEFTDREHYFPFGGGKFGGNMEFTAGGKEYRVERFFDGKSETKDSVKIFIDGKETEINDLGFHIFGLNADDFSRTAYIDGEIVSSATSAIGERIGNISDKEQSNVGERTLTKLTEKIRELKAGKGRNGLLDKMKDDKKKLADEIKDLSREEKNLGELYKARKELEENIAESEKLLEIAEIEKGKEHVRKIVSEKKEKAATLRKDAGDIAAKYNGEPPTKEEADALAGKHEKALNLARAGEREKLSEEEETEYAYYSEKFRSGIPQREERAEIKRLEMEIELAKNAVKERGGIKDARAEELARRFANGLPTEEETERISGKAKEYKDAKAASENYKNSVYKSVNGANKTLFLVLIAVAAAVVATGAGLFFLNAAVGAVAVAAGAIGLAVSLAFLFKGGAAVFDDKANIKSEEIKREIGEFLAGYGVYSGEDPAAEVGIFLNDAKEYAGILERTCEKRAKDEADERKIAENGEKIRRFLERYGAEEGEDVSALSEAAARYDALLRAKKNADARRAEETGEAKRLENETVAALLKKGFTFGSEKNVGDAIAELKDDAEKYASAISEAAATEEEAEKLEREYDLGKTDGQIATDYDGIREKCAGLRKDIAQKDKEIEDAEDRVARKADKEAALASLNEKYLEKEEKKRIMEKVYDLIERASEKMREKYVAPIRERFLYYAEKTEKTLGEKMTMDKDFSVSFERNGEKKKEKYLSAGQRAVCSLCLRLALIDKIYEDEKPFIIMDDPFSALDENHMEDMKKLLRTLAEDRQIVYFTCHKSRRI